MVSADLNWITAYDALIAAGYRVLALDHRGHGRGLRTPERFRLAHCSDDAAAILRHEGVERVIAVGYSMGRSDRVPARARPPGRRRRDRPLRDGAGLAGPAHEARLAPDGAAAPRARAVPERGMARGPARDRAAGRVRHDVGRGRALARQ